MAPIGGALPTRSLPLRRKDLAAVLTKTDACVPRPFAPTRHHHDIAIFEKRPGLSGA
jgi:hypothetical protein